LALEKNDSLSIGRVAKFLTDRNRNVFIFHSNSFKLPDGTIRRCGCRLSPSGENGVHRVQTTRKFIGQKIKMKLFSAGRWRRQIETRPMRILLTFICKSLKPSPAMAFAFYREKIH